jgi:hypothetical protein
MALLWFTENTLLSLSEATRLGHFRVFGKLIEDYLRERDVPGKILKQMRKTRSLFVG